jgi:ribose transport system substrate-binding protein
MKRWIGLVGVLTLVLAACGGNSTTSGPQASSTATADAATVAGLAQATQLVAKWTKFPTSVGYDKPIGKPIPTGKRLAFMNCGLPACVSLGKAADAAAKELGWTVEQVNFQPTPEAVAAAWAQVARTKPDGVIATGFPRVLFEASLQKLKAANIPVAECCVPDKVENGIIAQIGAANTEIYGEQFAAWLTVALKGSGEILWVNNQDYPVIPVMFQDMKTKLAELCPNCKVDSFDIAATEFGTTAPDKIVSYLRAHPNVRYVALGYDGMANGLPAAMAAAGIDVPFVGQDSDPPNKQYILDGKQAASIGFPLLESMWAAVDAIARYMVGVDVSVVQSPMPVFIYTKATVTSTGATPFVQDYQEQFKKMWGK